MTETYEDEDPTVTAIYDELERIPASPDATVIGTGLDDWDYYEKTDTYSRLFDVRKWTVPGPRYAEITVGAQQIASVVFDDDGGPHVENCRIDKWEMHIQVDDILTVDEARQVSAALLEAADELQTRQASQ
jgi:hypothetical protein